MLRHVRDVQGRLRRAFEAQLGRGAGPGQASPPPSTKARGSLWSLRIPR